MKTAAESSDGLETRLGAAEEAQRAGNERAAVRKAASEEPAAGRLSSASKRYEQTGYRLPEPESLEAIVARWEDLKRRSLVIAGELRKVDPKRGERQADCRSWVAWRHWYEHQVWRIAQSLACGQPKTCDACAHLRGVKLSRAFANRALWVMQDSPQLRGWHVTFTVRNGPDLLERFEHLRASLAAGFERVKNARKGRRAATMFAAPWAAVTAFEVKRGSRGGEWHPHAHALWLIPSGEWDWHVGRDGKPRLERGAYSRLVAEWNEITGDSHVLSARPFSSALTLEAGGQVDQATLFGELLEVFKYFTKPGELTPPDVVRAAELLRGRRLVDSRGGFRGVKVPADLTGDDPLDGPFIDVWHKWAGGAYVPFLKDEGSG